MFVPLFWTWISKAKLKRHLLPRFHLHIVMKKRWDKVDATVRTLCYLHDSRKRHAGLANFLIFAMESFKNLFSIKIAPILCQLSNHYNKWKSVSKSQSIIKSVSVQYILISETQVNNLFNLYFQVRIIQKHQFNRTLLSHQQDSKHKTALFSPKNVVHCAVLYNNRNFHRDSDLSICAKTFDRWWVFMIIPHPL